MSGSEQGLLLFVLFFLFGLMIWFDIRMTRLETRSIAFWNDIHELKRKELERNKQQKRKPSHRAADYFKGSVP